jgi:hypothetical protein
MRYINFRGHATNIRIFENLFSVEVSHAPEKLKSSIELTAA